MLQITNTGTNRSAIACHSIYKYLQIVIYLLAAVLDMRIYVKFQSTIIALSLSLSRLLTLKYFMDIDFITIIPKCSFIVVGDESIT